MDVFGLIKSTFNEGILFIDIFIQKSWVRNKGNKNEIDILSIND